MNKILKISFQLFLAGLCANSLQVYAQKLPAEFYFSSDGLRLIRGGVESPGFYNTCKIDTVFLTFGQTDYWTQLTNNYSSQKEILATLEYKGTTYDSVGVRFRGFTSYSQVKGQKKSFKISLDTIKTDQNIDGYTQLKLNNSFEDASFMREFIYEYFNRINIPAAKANFIVLFINGTSWGIYVNVQQLDKRHAKEWFTDADATRWRAEPSVNLGGGNPGGTPGGTPRDTTGGMPGGQPRDTTGGIPGVPPTDTTGGIPGGNPNDFGSMFGAGKSTLNYLDTLDSSVYKNYYLLKNSYKPNPWTDLVNACYKLNNTPDSVLVDTLGKYLDIDEALWFLAQEILFTDDDSYINKGGTDYYVYFDVGTDRIVPIEYDGNSALQTNYANSWSPFYKESNSSYPLASVLFNVPELRQRYLAHVRTILEKSFDQASADSIIDYYSNMIQSYVNNDTKKIYTYNQFTSEVSALKSFMSARRNFLLSNNEVKTSGLNISSVIYKSGDGDYSIPDSSQSVAVTAKVSGSSGTSHVYLYYGKKFMGTFKKVEMFDDGQHNDGIIGDNKYGASIPPYKKGTYVRFYVEAVAADAAATRSYYPAGAEHDVMVYRVKVAEAAQSSVVINELMSTNSYTAKDQDGEYDDWIELYNNSSVAVDISGYYLSDNDNKLNKWRFPSGTMIEGNSYLIVWADKDTIQEGLHANFKLSASGEEVALINTENAIVDEVVYNSQLAESSYQRIPNGTGSYTWTVPTYNKENKVTATNNITSNATSEQDKFDIFPNPATNILTVSKENSVGNQKLAIYSIYGTRIYYGNFINNTTIDVSSYKAGIYIVSVNSSVRKISIQH
jgi:hypothetical protein